VCSSDLDEIRTELHDDHPYVYAFTYDWRKDNRIAAEELKAFGYKPESSAGGLWVWWISFLILNLYTIVLGFLLGFPLIKKYLCPSCCGTDSCCDDEAKPDLACGSEPESECTSECGSEPESTPESAPAAESESGGEKIEALVTKLSELQIKLGLIGIGLAVWGFIATVIWAPSW